MKSSITLLASVGTGIAMTALVAAPVFACTPKGTIIKYVTDVTTGSKMVDANTVADALEVHPGDTLTYTVVIKNDGGTTKDDADAMIETTMTDTLPAGITLTAGSATTINETIGRISEKSQTTKTYSVKVSPDAKDGDVITNKACFTGEATNHDKTQHQAGCDVAIIKVKVPGTPTPPVTPPTTPTPPVTPPQVQATQTTLPNTGAGSWFVPAGIVGSLGYVGNMLRLKRRAAKHNR